MNPEDRLRRLRDDDRWNDEPFVLRAESVRRPRSLAPLKWASVSIGIAALLVGFVFLGSRAQTGVASGSAGSAAGIEGAPSAATRVVPWKDTPVASHASGTTMNGSDSTGSTASDGSAVTGLKATVFLRGTIRAGTTLEYEVVVKNTGTTSVTWRSCPAYTESLSSGGTTTTRSYLLNCASTGVLRPGAAVVFAMRIPVPSEATSRGTLTWTLLGGASATAAGAVTP